MSQHFFAATYLNRAITVTMGWDRPLSQFFLVVEYDNEEGEGFLYSNLSDPDAWDRPLAYYRDKLSELGIVVPESMFNESLRDQAFNVGNRYVWHEVDGSCREQAEGIQHDQR